MRSSFWLAREPERSREGEKERKSDDRYWINKAAAFPSRVNRISRFYFISSHSLRSRMIDPDDGRNINQNISWIFARRSYANVSIADCDEDTLKLLLRNNGKLRERNISQVIYKRKVSVYIAKLKIAQNDVLACKRHRKLQGVPRFTRRSS